MSATSPPVKRRRSNSPSPSPHHSSSKSNDKKISKHKKEKKSSKGDNHNNETHSSSKVNEYIINDEDYFNKSTEFQVWLREDKGIYFNDLSGEEAREKFSKFVKYWNKGKLAAKYYNGILASELPSSQRSGYRWKLKDMNEDELDRVRDSVDYNSRSKNILTDALQKSKSINESSQSLMQSSRGSEGRRSIVGPTLPPGVLPNVLSQARGLEDMDEEDCDRYLRSLQKKSDKKYRKSREADLEELVPKATGREAMLEKKRAINAFHKQERDIDVELGDKELMGNDDNFKARLAARDAAYQRRNAQREAAKMEKMAANAEKLQAYKEKEKATMEMFKNLAKHHQL